MKISEGDLYSGEKIRRSQRRIMALGFFEPPSRPGESGGVQIEARKTGDPKLVDLAATEDIENTLNYKSVSKRLIDFIEGSEFLLVETMAEEVAQLVMQEFGVRWLRLRLGKPGAIRGARDVGVLIERGEAF
jgi:dihydroneopterin aldolase